MICWKIFNNHTHESLMGVRMYIAYIGFSPRRQSSTPSHGKEQHGNKSKTPLAPELAFSNTDTSAAIEIQTEGPQ